MPSDNGHGSIPEIQIAFKRILKAGLANLPSNGYDEETLDEERPGSPEEDIVQLEQDDHRAIDFRNTLRTYVLSLIIIRLTILLILYSQMVWKTTLVYSQAARGPTMDLLVHF